MADTPDRRPDVEGIYADLAYTKGVTVANMAALIAWIEALEARQEKLEAYELRKAREMEDRQFEEAALDEVAYRRGREDG